MRYVVGAAPPRWRPKRFMHVRSRIHRPAPSPQPLLPPQSKLTTRPLCSIWWASRASPTWPASSTCASSERLAAAACCAGLQLGMRGARHGRLCGRSMCAPPPASARLPACLTFLPLHLITAIRRHSCSFPPPCAPLQATGPSGIHTQGHPRLHAAHAGYGRGGGGQVGGAGRHPVSDHKLRQLARPPQTLALPSIHTSHAGRLHATMAMCIPFPQRLTAFPHATGPGTPCAHQNTTPS